MKPLLWLLIGTVTVVFLASCPGPTGPIVYERIVIDAYGPTVSTGAPTKIDVTLMYDETTEVPGDEAPLISYRFEISDLSSGTYYIRVTSNTPGDQPYALRVLALEKDEDEPTAELPGTINFLDDPYETDDSDPDRNRIYLGNDKYVNRYFDEDGGDTVDWLYFVLP